MSTSVRLYYQDGSSHKFWQITQEDTHVALHYGKVGTQGQHRQKAFDNVQAAASYFQKQVQSKQKKGYQAETEVLPAEVSPSVKIPSAVSWHQAWKAFVRSARRRLLICQFEDPDPLAQQHFAQLRQQAIAPEPPSAISAALAPLFWHMVEDQSAVELLWQATGPLATVQAWRDSLVYGLRTHYDKNGLTLFLAPTSVTCIEGDLPHHLAFQGLYTYLDGLADSEKSELKACLHQVFAQGDLLAQIMSALLLADPDCLHTAAQSWLAQQDLNLMATWPQATFEILGNNALFYGGWLLWPFVTDAALQEAFLKRYLALSTYDLRPWVSQALCETGWAARALTHQGAQALPFLRAMAHHAQRVGERKRMTELLGTLPTETAMAALIELSGETRRAPLIHKLLQKDLELALQGAVRLLQQQPRHAQASALVHTWQQRSDWPTLWEGLSPEAQAVLPTLPRTQPPGEQVALPEAILSFVPSEARVSQGEPFPSPHVAWFPEDQPAQISRAIYGPLPLTPRQDEALMAALTADLNGKSTVFLDRLDGISAYHVVGFWNQLRVKQHRRWFRPEPEQLLCLLKRLGVEGLPGWLNYAEAQPTLAAPILARFAAVEVAPKMWHMVQGKSPLRQWAARWFAHHGTQALQACDEFLNARSPLSTLPLSLPEALLHHPVCTSRLQPLNDEALAQLNAITAQLSLHFPHPVLHAVQTCLTPDSLARYSDSLFQHWLKQGCPTEQEWMFLALKHFGDAQSIAMLVPYLLKWPGERAYQRSQVGLEILEQMDVPEAIFALETLRLQARYPSLKTASEQSLANLALRRGLSPEALSDRLVPDLGLDAAGQQRWRAGDESLRWTLLKGEPVLFHRKGNGPEKPCKRVPKALAEAQPLWKTFATQARKQVKWQHKRLEWALIVQRRWSWHEARTLVCEHPLLQHLVADVIWGVWQQEQAYDLTFVYQDGVCRDARGQAVQVLEDCEVVLAHPVYMLSSLVQWQFQSVEEWISQRQRGAYFAEPLEWCQEGFTQVPETPVESTRLLALTNRHWRSASGDGELSLQLPLDYQAYLYLEHRPYMLTQAQNTRVYGLQVLKNQGCPPLPPALLPPHFYSELRRTLVNLWA